MSGATRNRALQRLGLNGKGTFGFYGHGFRATASTRLNELGYTHYVSGMCEPDLQTLVRIAKTLGSGPDVLLGVKAGPSDTPRGLLLSKIAVSAALLGDTELSSMAVQLEALAASRRGKESGSRNPAQSHRSTMPPDAGALA